MLPGPPLVYEAAYLGATVLPAHQMSDCWELVVVSFFYVPCP